MLKIARACCIVAVAASATLSVMAESTAATSKIDPESAKIVQRMKAMRLPEVSFKLMAFDDEGASWRVLDKVENYKTTFKTNALAYELGPTRLS